MNNFLLIKSDGYGRNGQKLTPLESANALLTSRIWPLWEHTRNRKAIATNDYVAVYLSGKGMSKVIAKAKIESVVPWTESVAKDYPLQLDGIPYSVLKLSNIETFDRHIDVRTKLSQLSFINKKSIKWGVAFMGGSRALNRSDFELITTN